MFSYDLTRVFNKRKISNWVKDKHNLFFLNSHWYLWNHTLSNKMNGHEYDRLKRNKSFNSGVDSSTCTCPRSRYFNYIIFNYKSSFYCKIQNYYSYDHCSPYKHRLTEKSPRWSDPVLEESFSKLFWITVDRNQK